MKLFWLLGEVVSWTLQSYVQFDFIIYYLFANMFPDDGSDA